MLRNLEQRQNEEDNVMHRRNSANSQTIAQKRLTREEVRFGAALALADDQVDVDRPSCRGECRSAARPCPWVGCRHHLYIDVNPRTGSLKLNFPELTIEEMPETCALDVAERGGVTLDAIGKLMNLTRERVRQMERLALLNARTTVVHRRLDDGLGIRAPSVGG